MKLLYTVCTILIIIASGNSASYYYDLSSENITGLGFKIEISEQSDVIQFTVIWDGILLLPLNANNPRSRYRGSDTGWIKIDVVDSIASLPENTRASLIVKKDSAFVLESSLDCQLDKSIMFRINREYLEESTFDLKKWAHDGHPAFIGYYFNLKEMYNKLRSK